MGIDMTENTKHSSSIAGQGGRAPHRPRLPLRGFQRGGAPLAALVLLLLCLSGCAEKYTGPDLTDPFATDAVVASDLVNLPQDLTVYANKAGADRMLLSPDAQRIENEKYDTRFFAPWKMTRPSVQPSAVFEAVQNLNPAKMFGNNLRPFSQERWQALVDNCNRESYAGRSGPLRHAITVANVNLRRMPTNTPYFDNPRKGGEGFPFDYFQVSSLYLGTPVAVIHTSRDGAWVYVETRLFSGWAPIESIAAVDADFIRVWMAAPLAAVLKDHVVLTPSAPADEVTGRAVPAMAHIGTVLPYSGSAFGGLSLLYPARGASGLAVTRSARVMPDAAAPKPLPLTPGNIAMIGNRMMGQPYGWGGLFDDRDCSAMTKDIFTPFGIWLPRNSINQNRMGMPVTVTGLSPDEKERRIMAEGVPFFSLVTMKGHVGLYLGSYPLKGKEVPVMFHNVWGVRVTDPMRLNPDGTHPVGRAIIGKAVVTSLRPGAEHKLVTSPASILDRIDGLSVLPERAK